MMQPISNWEQVKANDGSEFVRPNGGYIAKIMNIKNVMDKQYLEVSFDIVTPGEFQNYYRKLYDKANFWAGKSNRSYKDSALPYFKGFITSVEESNQGYRWNWNEEMLKGKMVGVIISQEEYLGNDGKVKIKDAFSFRSVKTIQSGDFTVPELKKLNQTSQSNNQATTNQFTQSNVPMQDFGISSDDIQF